MKLTEKNALLKQLENHNKSAPKSLNDAELQELFKKTIIEWTRGFIASNSGNQQTKIINLDEAEQEIRLKLRDAEDFYKTFHSLLEKHSYQTICDAVPNSVRANLLQKSLLMLEVKYREYQEILLDEIEKLVGFMPKEELASFMDFIESKREDVELLKGIKAQLEDPNITHDIDRISNTKKYILTHFMPQDLEANYHEFFAHAEDKQALIAKLKSISNAYTKRELDNMTKEDLIDILGAIKQGEIDAKRDKEDFERYFGLFKQALYDDNEDAFGALVIRVFDEVSSNCLHNLRLHLRSEDPTFESKFQAAQSEINRFK